MRKKYIPFIILLITLIAACALTLFLLSDSSCNSLPASGTGEVSPIAGEYMNSGTPEKAETLYKMRSEIKSIPEIEGTWQRTNVPVSYSASIDISSVSAEGFDIVVNAYYYSHYGLLEGHAAWIDAGTAVCRFDLYDNVQYIVFLWDNSSLRVKATGASFEMGFGANVTMDGEYTRNEPVYTNANILHDTFTDEQLCFLNEKLPAEQYECFVFTTENGLVDISEENSVKTISAWVPTMAEYRYTLLIENGTIRNISFANDTEFVF